MPGWLPVDAGGGGGAVRYPVTLTKDDNDTYMVTFPDVLDAVTFGETKEEALSRAADALLTVFDAYMKDRRDIPAPSDRAGASIDLPALETSKIELYRAMRENKVGKSELAKRLKWHLPQVDRVLDVHHGSQIDQMEAALSALGKKLVVTIVDAGGKVEKIVDTHRQVVGKAAGQATTRRRPVHGAIITAALRQRAAGGTMRVSSRGTKRAAKKR